MDIEFIGYAATLCSITTLVPEILKALKTHHLRDLSWGMIVLMTLSSSLWATYGTAKSSPPLQISASVNLLFEAVLIYLKLHYDKHKRPFAGQKAAESVAISSEEQE